MPPGRETSLTMSPPRVRCRARASPRPRPPRSSRRKYAPAFALRLSSAGHADRRLRQRDGTLSGVGRARRWEVRSAAPRGAGRDLSREPAVHRLQSRCRAAAVRPRREDLVIVRKTPGVATPETSNARPRAQRMRGDMGDFLRWVVGRIRGMGQRKLDRLGECQAALADRLANVASQSPNIESPPASRLRNRRGATHR